MSGINADRSSNSSSVTSNPTFRAMAMNTVAIVPLLSSSTESSNINYSLQSFEHLMESLERYALQRVGGQDYSPTQQHSMPAPCGTPSVHKDIEIIIPNEQLTRPGDWKYDNTPLRSHAWHSGCQRMVCFDGRDLPPCPNPKDDSVQVMSPWAQDRLSKNPIYQAFSDLYPCRGTSAVIGVISVKDLESIETLVKAERELVMWTERYTLPSYRAQQGSGLVQGWDTHGNSYEDKMHVVTRRIFIFDTFDDTSRQKMDLSQTRLFKSGQLVAFPPAGTNMMDLHLNVVLNDLAVAIFLQLEDRIRLCDGSKTKSISRRGSSAALGTTKGDEPVGPTEKLGISNLVTLVGPGNNPDTAGRVESKTEEESGLTLFSSAIKAFNSTKGPETTEYLHFTPVDTRFVMDKLSSKELEYIVRRNAGRREKYSGDLCLLAGSPMDAYERYTRATELSKRNHDPLYYAASLEGCAASFVAMSDTGGHGVDEYLDENFQFPDDVMALVMANQQGGQDSKVDKTKTTMPAAISALMEEALSVVRCHIQLSSIHSEMLLKMAWYTAELEEGHLHCRWGEGCYEGLDANRPSQLKRWQKSSVAKLTLDGIDELTDPLLSTKNLAQSQKFCDLLHRATFNGGLDLLTRSSVASRCATLCLSGVKNVTWPFPTIGSSYSRATFPRKAALFSHVAAESFALSPKSFHPSMMNHLWLYAFSLHSLDENLFSSSDQYAWASVRVTLLHSLIRRADISSIENAAFCLLHLLSEISGDPTMKNSSSVSDSIISINQNSISDVDIDISDLVTKTSKKEAISRRTNPTRSRFSVQGVTSFAFLQSKWLDDDPVPLIPFPFVDPTLLVRLLKDELKSHPYVKDLILSVNRLPSYPSLNCVIPLKDGECQLMSDHCLNVLDKNVVPNSNYSSTPEISLVNTSPIHIASVSLAAPLSHLSLERVKADKTSSQTAMKAVFFNPFAKSNNAKNITSEITIAEGEERMIEIGFENSFLVPIFIQNCNLLFDCNGNYRVESAPQSFTVPPRATNYIIGFPFIVLPTSSIIGNESDYDCAPFSLTGIKFSYLRQSQSFQISSDDTTNIPASHQEKRQVAEPANIYRRSAHNYKDKSYAIKSMVFEPIPAQPKLLINMASSGDFDLGDGLVVPVEISEGEMYTVPLIRIQNSIGSGIFHRLQIIWLTSSDVILQYLYDTSSDKTHQGEVDTKQHIRRSSTSRLDDTVKAQSVQIEIVKNNISLDSLNRYDTESTISFAIRGSSPGSLVVADGSTFKLRFRYRGPSAGNGLEYWRKKDIQFRIVKVKGPRISSITLHPEMSWSDSYSWLGAIKTPSNNAEEINYHVANEGIFAVIEIVNESSFDIVIKNQSGKICNLKGEALTPMSMTSGAIIQIPIILPKIRHSTQDDYLSTIVMELSKITLFEWVSRDLNGPEPFIKPMMVERRGLLQTTHDALEVIGAKRKLVSFPPVELAVTCLDRSECFHTGDSVNISVYVKVSEWVLGGLGPGCFLSIQLLCYKKDCLEPFSSNNDYLWCGQSKISHSLSIVTDTITHGARLCFLYPGFFTVTACASFVGTPDCTVNECWLAKDPCIIEIKEVDV